MPEMPSPPGCVKYFVPGLPDWITNEHLSEHFSQFGQVVGAAIVKDKGTENSRGFGYLTMIDVSSQPALLTSKHQFGDAVVQVLLTKDSLTGYDVKKVHLGKLNHDITAEALREVFSQFGLVLDVHTPKDPVTGERKNFGFVTFATDDAFHAAVQAATVPIGPSCVVTVKPAAQTSAGGAGPSKGPSKGGGADWGPWGCGWGPKGGGKDPWSAMMAWKGGKGGWGGDDSWGSAGSNAGGGGSRNKRDGVKYFVPGLPEFVTDTDLQRHFSQYGTVVDAAVVKEKGSEASRGFGYVTFADGSNQAAVLGAKHVFGDRAISIMLTKDSLSGGNVKKVHLGQLPAHLSADSIREAFANFGLVIDVHTPKDPNTGERKNFGFVTYAGDDSFNAVIAAGTVMVEGHAISVKPAAQSRENNDAGFPGCGKSAGKDAGKGMGKEAFWGGWDAWGWGPWGGCDSWGSSYDPWSKGGGKWGGSKGCWDASGPYDAKGSCGPKGGFDGKGGPKGCGPMGGCGDKGGCGGKGGASQWGGGGLGGGCGKGGGDGGWAAAASAGGKDFSKGGCADASWGAGAAGCGAQAAGAQAGWGGADPAAAAWGQGAGDGFGGSSGSALYPASAALLSAGTAVAGGMGGMGGGAEAAWGGAGPNAGAWGAAGPGKGGGGQPMVGPGCWAAGDGGACAGGGQLGMVGPGCWAGMGKGGCQPMVGPY